MSGYTSNFRQIAPLFYHTRAAASIPIVIFILLDESLETGHKSDKHAQNLEDHAGYFYRI